MEDKRYTVLYQEYMLAQIYTLKNLHKRCFNNVLGCCMPPFCDKSHILNRQKTTLCWNCVNKIRIGKGLLFLKESNNCEVKAYDDGQTVSSGVCRGGRLNAGGDASHSREAARRTASCYTVMWHSNMFVILNKSLQISHLRRSNSPWGAKADTANYKGGNISLMCKCCNNSYSESTTQWSYLNYVGALQFFQRNRVQMLRRRKCTSGRKLNILVRTKNLGISSLLGQKFIIWRLFLILGVSKKTTLVPPIVKEFGRRKKNSDNKIDIQLFI